MFRLRLTFKLLDPELADKRVKDLVSGLKNKTVIMFGSPENMGDATTLGLLVV